MLAYVNHIYFQYSAVVCIPNDSLPNKKWGEITVELFQL